jgi:hypothetical protein
MRQFSARWLVHYRTRVSGSLRQRRKMTSSGKELFRRGVAKKKILSRRRGIFPSSMRAGEFPMGFFLIDLNRL